MPWTSRQRAVRFLQRTAVAAILTMLWLTPAPSADEKQLSIYGPQVSYSLPIQQHNGQDYVGLLEMLEPLGNVSANAEGDKWKLKFANSEVEFRAEANLGKVAGQKFGLPAPFVLDGGRGLVPLRALPGILGLILGAKLEYHEAGRRLFLNGAATRFTTEVHDGALSVNFTAPVNPIISTEPGKLKMTFTRDPVVSNAYIMRLESPLVSSVSFSENNGRAELSVQGRVPLLAKFAAGGQTIDIVAAPTEAQPASPTTAVAVPPPPTLSSLLAKPPFLVMLDPGHGGDDRGTALSDTLQEKDVTLAFARRLRGELQSHGISTVMTRDADVTVSSDQRAAMADAARVAVFISLHAGSLGRGVRVCSPLVHSSTPKPGGFLSWDSAQAGYVLTSRALADLVKAEVGKHEIPGAELSAPVRPLNNIAAAAIAIEIAPSGTDVASVSSGVYQQRIAAAIAEAITVGHAKVEAER